MTIVRKPFDILYNLSGNIIAYRYYHITYDSIELSRYLLYLMEVKLNTYFKIRFIY